MSSKYSVRLLIGALILSGSCLSLVANAESAPIEERPLFPPDCVGLDRTYSALIADFEEQFPGFWHAGNLAEYERQVSEMADDGLEAGSYLPGISDKRCRDKLLTQAYLKALFDLKFGRVDAGSTGLVWYDRQVTHAERLDEVGHLLKDSDGDIVKAFSNARPDLRAYITLRSAYRHMRGRMPQSWPLVEAGETLKPGQNSSRIVPLKTRLGAEGWLEVPVEGFSPDFDAATERAVREFQRTRGLQVDGIVGPATLKELNRQPRELFNQVVVNLERLRWFANDIRRDYLLVDLAGARVSLVHEGNVRWQSRVQIGRPNRPTPVLRSRLTHITLNPTWTVPPTILRRDKLPEIRKDLAYLSKNRIRVLDINGRELSPSSINWRNPGPIILRQDAGPESALGLVAFRFPNPFSVYLHDTPSKALFERDIRLFSSGCVRVEGAMALARMLFEDAAPETKLKFDTILNSGKTRNLNLPQPLVLILSYLTVETSESGEIRFRQDTYDLDNRLLQLLEG